MERETERESSFLDHSHTLNTVITLSLSLSHFSQMGFVWTTFANAATSVASTVSCISDAMSGSAAAIERCGSAVRVCAVIAGTMVILIGIHMAVVFFTWAVYRLFAPFIAKQPAVDGRRAAARNASVAVSVAMANDASHSHVPPLRGPPRETTVPARPQLVAVPPPSVQPSPIRLPGAVVPPQSQRVGAIAVPAPTQDRDAHGMGALSRIINASMQTLEHGTCRATTTVSGVTVTATAPSHKWVRVRVNGDVATVDSGTHANRTPARSKRVRDADEGHAEGAAAAVLPEQESAAAAAGDADETDEPAAKHPITRRRRKCKRLTPVRRPKHPKSSNEGPAAPDDDDGGATTPSSKRQKGQ